MNSAASQARIAGSEWAHVTEPESVLSGSELINQKYPQMTPIDAAIRLPRPVRRRDLPRPITVPHWAPTHRSGGPKLCYPPSSCKHHLSTRTTGSSRRKVSLLSRVLPRCDIQCKYRTSRPADA